MEVVVVAEEVVVVVVVVEGEEEGEEEGVVVVVVEVHKVVCMVVVGEVGSLACIAQGLHSNPRSNREHTYHGTYLHTSGVPLVVLLEMMKR